MSHRENPSLQGGDDYERQTKEGINSLANQTGFVSIKSIGWYSGWILSIRIPAISVVACPTRLKHQRPSRFIRRGNPSI